MTAPRRSRAGWILGAIAAVGFVAFWAWVLFIAPSAPEDKLNSNAFPVAAQPVCTSVINDLDASQLLNQTATTPAERADLVERQDTKLATMVQRVGCSS